MAFLHSTILRRVTLTFILLWGIAPFYYLNQDSAFLLWTFFLSAGIVLYFIWYEVSAIFILIYLSFVTAYAFNVFLFQFSIPFYVAMIGILLVYGYLFTYMEQKIGILGNKRLIYLLLFSLIILQVFLITSFFLISPINQSLIIAVTSYLFVGYCYTILAKHSDNNFYHYVLFSALALFAIFTTADWSGLV